MHTTANNICQYSAAVQKYKVMSTLYKIMSADFTKNLEIINFCIIFLCTLLSSNSNFLILISLKPNIVCLVVVSKAFKTFQIYF